MAGSGNRISGNLAFVRQRRIPEGGTSSPPRSRFGADKAAPSDPRLCVGTKLGHFVVGLAAVWLNIAAIHAALPPPREACRHDEFQFSVQAENRGVDGRAARTFTAYLWIPPSAARVRGVAGDGLAWVRMKRTVSCATLWVLTATM